MIDVTERAAKQIVAMREAEGVAASLSLRVELRAGEGPRFHYDLFFDEPDESDEVIARHGVTFLLRPESAPYLDGSVIDWVDDGQSAGFVVTNPNEREG